MADIAEVESTDPVQLLGQGRRHLAVRDFPSAVASLGRACELLAQQHGQRADQCGEAYFWYGKSLLGLAREESGVLGDGIPQGGEENQDDDEDDDEDDAVDEDNNEETEKNGEDDNKTDDAESKEKKMEEKEVTKEAAEASLADVSDSATDVSISSANVSNSVIDKETTSGTGDAPSDSGEGSSGLQVPVEGSEEEEDGEDEVENLQLAWEVLEIARDIFLKRGDSGRLDLADVYLHLGEISLESETYDKAVTDMSKSLEILKELHSPDSRRIAETHYQIGLAYSLSNGFDDAVMHFKTAAEILETRIKSLEAPTASTEDASVKKFMASDPFYSIEGEVKELKELLPEIREKIQDMIDYKAEAIRSVRESLGIAPSNGAATATTNGSSSDSKPVEKKISDISHLVRRKRKPSDEGKIEEESAAKKPAK